MEARKHTQTNLSLLREKLDSGGMRSAQMLIGTLHPSELARLLESLPLRERAVIWDMVDPENEGEVLTRDQILREVWGFSRAPRTRTVDVHVTWLRGKLEPDRANPRFIRRLKKATGPPVATATNAAMTSQPMGVRSRKIR